MDGRWFITGTDTEVGKTVATACLAAGARHMGRTVVAAKPVASGVVRGTPGEDATLLGFGAGHPPEVFATFEAPVSPDRAAEFEGRSVPAEPMRHWIQHQHAQCVLIEGVGGWRVRVGDGFEVTDLARWTQGRVLVVAADRLGVLNHTRLTVEAIQADGHAVAGIILNRGIDDGELSRNTNLEDLRELLSMPVVPLAQVATTELQAMQYAGCALWHGLTARQC